MAAKNVTTTAQATAAPTTVMLGDRQYRVSPLVDKDYGEFEKWVQDRHIALAQRNLEGLSDDNQEKLLKHAYDRAARITMASAEVMVAVATLEGSIKLFWLHLRRAHPDLSESDVFGLIVNAETQEVDTEALDEASRAMKRVAPRKTGKKSRAGGAKKKRVPTRRQ